MLTTQEARNVAGQATTAYDAPVPGASTVIAAEAEAPAASTRVVRLDAAWLAAGACSLAGLIALWLTNGVGGGDVALYLAYVGGLVVLPGVLIAAVLDRRPLGLTHVCVGIPLGFLQVMLAFILFAAIGVRGLAPWEPLAGAAVAAWLLVRRRTAFAVEVSARFRWDAVLVTAIALASAGLMVSRDFATHPLPGQIGSSGATYYTDIPWHIGNTAELKTYWPPRDLRVLGKGFKYYIGDYLQAAGTSIATGIQPETLLLRLDPLFQLVVFAFQLFWMGRVLGRKARTGVVAVFLVLLVGDLSAVKRATESLFVNLFLHDMYLSPTYLIGLVFFVPLLGVLVEWLRRPTALRSGRFIALSLLTIGCGLSKSTTLPLLVACGFGLLGYEAVRRRFGGAGLALAALGLVTYVVLLPLEYWHGQARSLDFSPLDKFRGSGADALLAGTFLGRLPQRVPHSEWIIPTVVALGSAPALLLAAGSYLVVRRARLPSAEAAVGFVAAAGMAVILLFTGVGGGEAFFWHYGYVAFALVAALGVDALLEARRKSWLRNAVLASVAAFAVLGVASTVLQAGPQARRVLARAVPGIPGPFHVEPPNPAELTAPEVRGLLWLRGHSPPKSVVATNNQSRLEASRDGRYFYYSALSQRQFLLEGYEYTNGFLSPRTREAEAELQQRLHLLDRIYRDGSAAAIEEAHRRFGVSYLLVDARFTDAAHPFPSSAARLVFADRDLRIYAVVA